MNHDNITRWIEALRSGQYTKTSRSLRNGLGFCSLGVYCDVIEPDGWEYNGTWRHSGESGTLPSHMIYDVDKYILDHGDLIIMNDDLNMSFFEIADELEYYLVHGTWTDDTQSRVNYTKET